MGSYLEVTLNITIGLLIGTISYQPSAAARNHSSLQSLATPKALKIAWILKPPYTELSANRSSVNVAHGMFRDALLRFIIIECGLLYDPDPTNHQVENLKVDNELEMIELLRQSNVDIAFPISEHPFNRRYREFPFLKLEDYPGAEFITTEDNSSALDVVLKAVIKAWPLLTVNIVLSAIAGIIMWALVGNGTLLFFTLLRAVYIC